MWMGVSTQRFNRHHRRDGSSVSGSLQGDQIAVTLIPGRILFDRILSRLFRAVLSALLPGPNGAEPRVASRENGSMLYVCTSGY